MSILMIKLAVPLLSLVVGMAFFSAPMELDGPVIGAPEAVGELREVEMDVRPPVVEDGDAPEEPAAPVVPDPVVE